MCHLKCPEYYEKKHLDEDYKFLKIVGYLGLIPFACGAIASLNKRTFIDNQREQGEGEEKGTARGRWGGGAMDRGERGEKVSQAESERVARSEVQGGATHEGGS